MNKPTILCVDDERIVLSSLKMELKTAFQDTYDIEIAEDGSEALEIFSELISNNVDIPLVISDHIMAGMKGDDLLIKINKIKPETRKIMLTGQADIGAVGNAVNNADLYRYIAKPWDSKDLSLTINEAVKSYYQSKKLKEQNIQIRELNTNLENIVQERTKELIDAVAAKDKFLSIIAHDIRNPLQTIMLSGELIEMDVENMDKNEILKLSSGMLNSSRQINNLLEDLLDWARNQSGHISYKPDNFNIKEVIEKNINLLKANAETKNILIEMLYDTDQKEVNADVNMVSTVIRNLISNAIKFTPNQGKIQIKAISDSNKFYISVIDNGVGISEKNIDKLFRIDCHFSTHGTENEAGTGLGLIMCKDFIEKNKGEITVSSNLGEGTSFNFWLPQKS